MKTNINNNGQADKRVNGRYVSTAKNSGMDRSPKFFGYGATVAGALL